MRRETIDTVDKHVKNTYTIQYEQ